MFLTQNIEAAVFANLVPLVVTQGDKERRTNTHQA